MQRFLNELVKMYKFWQKLNIDFIISNAILDIVVLIIPLIDLKYALYNRLCNSNVK